LAQQSRPGHPIDGWVNSSEVEAAIAALPELLMVGHELKAAALSLRDLITAP
jgi:hypothetical protein